MCHLWISWNKLQFIHCEKSEVKPVKMKIIWFRLLKKKNILQNKQQYAYIFLEMEKLKLYSI